MVKLWDLRNTSQCVSSHKLANQIEDFCFRKEQLVVANGNSITLVDLNKQMEGVGEFKFEEQTSFFPFQKPASKVRYDAHRDRIIAGGLDSQLKFFQATKDAPNDLQVAYKIKVPSEIFAFDFSADGNHFALGLNDGSLIIKSKSIEKEEEEVDAEQKLFDSFEPKLISTSKNYKYFFRGQYVVQADPDDIRATEMSKKRRLQPYE